MNVVILAAGKGTRMKSDLPKVLHPVGGVPMLAHVLKTASALMPAKCIVVIGHGGNQVKEFFSSPEMRGEFPAIDWVVQDPPLGTGHAVSQAINLLDRRSPTLVLYGDVPLITAQTLKTLEKAGQGGLAVLTAELEHPHGYGRVMRDSDGRITAIIEEKDAHEHARQIREINTGTLIAPTPALVEWLSRLNNDNAQKEFYLTDVIGMAFKEGKTIGSAQPATTDEILGINSQAQRAQIERHYQRRLALSAMEAGVTLADPERFDVRGRLSCGPDVSIDVGCIFEGKVDLGTGVIIGPHCVIRDSVIADGARIEAFSHLQDARIGPRAVVGPYARLRPGSVLGEGAHVGNFVEIKNASLGSQSKANHLSYLGDAEIGNRVNIGAGTITCNYDGAEKHRTVIEDDVFIGSDTQLVAPVTVGRGATLGAGTTLTQDAPAEQLTVSRAAQVSIPRWKRPRKKAH